MYSTDMMSRNRVLPKEESRMKLQGIVAILNNSDDYDGGGGRPKATSFRRTLSADMSSKQWLSQNGLLKKSFSSDEVSRPLIEAVDSSSLSSSSDGEDEFATQDRVWMSFNKMQKSDDGWDSILQCGGGSACRVPPPYVHPLVKRSTSGLSERSLEVCTESLGSETGSDCFWPEEFVGEEGDRVKETTNRLSVRSYKASPPPPRPLPPPMSSIAGGGSLRIHSQRRDGRLILEAVSVPPKRYFHAQRENGRLILRSINNSQWERDNDEFERVFDAMEEIREETDGGGVVEAAAEEGSKSEESAGPMKLEEELGFTVLPQSLPPPQPRIAIPLPAAASFNAYDYFWRKKTAVPVGFIGGADHRKNRNHNLNKKNGNEEYEYGYGGGCKEARRASFSSIWAPYCIATS